MTLLRVIPLGVVLPLLAAAAASEIDPARESDAREGRRISIDGAVLFVPSDLRLEDETVDLLVHFHGDPDTVEREFQASEIGGVLVTVNRKGLSAVYAAAFEAPERFSGLLDEALERLRSINSIPEPLRWRMIRISSFSAGYGAVREILKDQRNVERIDALCMADSIYAGYVEPHENRQVNPEHMLPWRRFAAAAAQGRKRFILTHTDLVPGHYASTREVAEDLIAHVGAKREKVAGWHTGSIEVRSMAGKNGFAVYGCPGDDGEAHMQHLRHLSQWLRLLNASSFEPEVNAEIRTAIKTYEPPWLPDEEGMKDLTIVLHPANPDPPAEGARSGSGSRLSIQTAAYLYHLIREGGGEAILTRVDLYSPPAGQRDTASPGLIRRCRASGADLLLVFDPAASGETDAPADELTTALAASLNGIPGIRAANLPLPPDDLGCFALRIDVAHASPSGMLVEHSTLPAHRRHAETLYQTLVSWLERHGATLRLRQADRTGQADALPEEAPFPETRKRRQDRIALLARSIWSDGPLPLDKAEWFASVFLQLSLSDRTIVYFQPRIDLDQDAVVIGGATSVPVLADTLVSAFRSVGIDNVRNEMRLLPDTDRLGGDLYGLCRVTTVLTRQRTGQQGMPQSQLLYGEPVYLLDRHEDELLIQAGDGYWGWLPADAIACVDRDRFSRNLQSDRAALLEDIEHGDLLLPRGARLPIVSRTSDVCTLLTLDDHRVEVPAGSVRPMEQERSHETRALRAIEWLNTPYVFGGRSPFGPDCSGFVTNLFEQEGTPIARDAAGQFLSGRLVATRWHRGDIRTGDRLYFINQSGKVFHTGIALTPTHFIHASPPAVQISSLQPGDRLYDDRWDQAFLVAKRP